ncbi:uncharacterized protein LOC111830100 [Capsella rubella]|uniref:uncharacterized protein LOC111830100 n=1 Tax=Capsella rubella TaxID=81985 RepID=UPI000CD51E29|nr:uncharacterized protein LOC111830100 [Capsella rubella]
MVFLPHIRHHIYIYSQNSTLLRSHRRKLTPALLLNLYSFCLGNSHQYYICETPCYCFYVTATISVGVCFSMNSSGASQVFFTIHGSKYPQNKALNHVSSNTSFSDLPSELLEIIMSHLDLEDNIRVSAACKSLFEFVVYARVVEKAQLDLCVVLNVAT